MKTKPKYTGDDLLGIAVGLIGLLFVIVVVWAYLTIPGGWF